MPRWMEKKKNMKNHELALPADLPPNNTLL